MPGRRTVADRLSQYWDDLRDQHEDDPDHDPDLIYLNRLFQE